MVARAQELAALEREQGRVVGLGSSLVPASLERVSRALGSPVLANPLLVNRELASRGLVSSRRPAGVSSSHRR